MGSTGYSGSNDPSQWDPRQIDQWFEKGEWLNGWNVKPDPSINRKAFAASYFSDKKKWDEAFAFLSNTGISQGEFKKYDISEKVYAIVSKYLSKNGEDARYEAHKKYIDIQYVFDGRELIGHTTLNRKKDVLVPYDDEKDIEFMTVTEGRNLRANPGSFFIFFPDDIHRPGLKDGENAPVSKIVVKVRVEGQ